MKWLVAVALLALTSSFLLAQKSRVPITNADVISMTKAGLAEQTIVLAISQGLSDFDTSPQALVQLKKAGVSDRVLNAMLAAPRGGLSTGPQSQAMPVHIDPAQLLDKALDAIAPREKLTSINATRYVGQWTQIRPDATGSVREITHSEYERITSYPDRVHIAIRTSTWPARNVVLTPDFNYVTNGTTTNSIPTADLTALRSGFHFDPPYIAQHPHDLTLFYDGTVGTGTEKRDLLRLRDSDGKEVVWSLDDTGRIRRITNKRTTGETTMDLADYRLVEGVHVAFIRHSVENGSTTTDLVVTQYQINPPLDPGWFAGLPPAASKASTKADDFYFEISNEKPSVVASGGSASTASLPAPPRADPSTLWGRTANEVSEESSKASSEVSSLPPAQPSGGLRIKVLQEQSNPYFVQTGTSTSTTCSSAGVTTTCNSNDTTNGWHHIQNVMLVEASDGREYTISCDRMWPWSKCVSLRAGDTFNARNTSKGMAVQYLNTKGKETEATYDILQSKSLR
jgi:hypothetical protein